jgi:signal transduction histidine kinase
MPDGGWVAVEASRVALDAEAARRAGVERPGDYARVSVSDTGVGIPPADQARVFEPFFTTKDVDKGTGLGLAIAYGIMKQHGGGIGLESEPGHGAAFTCYLPVRGAATDAPAVGLEAANAPAPEAEPRPERAAAAGRRDA